MSKKTKRPTRRTKGPNDPWLPQNLQGRKFKVTMVVVKPRITLLTEGGLEENEIQTLEVAWHRSEWQKTLAEFLRSVGLEIESA